MAKKSIWQNATLLAEEREEPLKRQRQKSQYSVDLSGLHAVCESNYQRLLQLFPGYETSNHRDFELDGGVRVRIDVVERCRYTTLFQVQQQGSANSWLHAPRFDLRAYHDARMVEVTGFQSQRQVEARYAYPNQQMLAPDEKTQQNLFLAEWLGHCLEQGQSAISFEPNPTGELSAP